MFHVPEDPYAKEIEAVDSIPVGSGALRSAFPCSRGVSSQPLALEKVARENRTRDELMRGVYLRDVYEKYGVL